MDIKQLRTEIIKPILNYLGLYSKEAEELLLGTACQESQVGHYIRQIGCNGITGAFGIYQMEIRTANDIWNNFLIYKKDLAEKVESLKIKSLTTQDNLKYNLAYATAMCRIHYLRVKEEIPVNRFGQAQYWKKYYNTASGKGTIEEYLQNWNKFNA